MAPSSERRLDGHAAFRLRRSEGVLLPPCRVRVRQRGESPLGGGGRPRAGARHEPKSRPCCQCAPHLTAKAPPPLRRLFLRSISLVVSPATRSGSGAFDAALAARSAGAEAELARLRSHVWHIGRGGASGVRRVYEERELPLDLSGERRVNGEARP